MSLVTVGCGLLFCSLVLALYWKARPILKLIPLDQLLFSASWHPFKKEFGFLPFLIGTFWVTAVAMLLAVPLCILTAIYLSEYAIKRVREIVIPLIDLLSGIPSVVYGMWGVLIIVPLIKNRVAPFFHHYSSGYCILAGGVVLAIMISPIIIHVCLEVLKSVSSQVREVSLALGATKWQTIKHVVLRKASPGIIAAVALGLSRALGETMAVLMVAGNVAKIPKSLFDPVYPLPALIANNYGEMLSIPMYDSALLLAALLLLGVVLFFNIVSRLVIIRVENRI